MKYHFYHTLTQASQENIQLRTIYVWYRYKYTFCHWAQ